MKGLVVGETYLVDNKPHEFLGMSESGKPRMRPVTQPNLKVGKEYMVDNKPHTFKGMGANNKPIMKPVQSKSFSKTKSFLHGLGSDLSFNFADEVEALMRGEKWKNIMSGEGDVLGKVRQRYKKAKADNPKSYVTGEWATLIGPAAVPSLVRKGLKLGAKKLTKDELIKKAFKSPTDITKALPVKKELLKGASYGAGTSGLYALGGTDDKSDLKAVGLGAGLGAVTGGALGGVSGKIREMRRPQVVKEKLHNKNLKLLSDHFDINSKNLKSIATDYKGNPSGGDKTLIAGLLKNNVLANRPTQKEIIRRHTTLKDTVGKKIDKLEKERFKNVKFTLNDIKELFTKETNIGKDLANQTTKGITELEMKKAVPRINEIIETISKENSKGEDINKALKKAIDYNKTEIADKTTSQVVIYNTLVHLRKLLKNKAKDNFSVPKTVSDLENISKNVGQTKKGINVKNKKVAEETLNNVDELANNENFYSILKQIEPRPQKIGDSQKEQVQEAAENLIGRFYVAGLINALLGPVVRAGRNFTPIEKKMLGNLVKAGRLNDIIEGAHKGTLQTLLNSNNPYGVASNIVRSPLRAYDSTAKEY